jgi:hypothetical protein
MLKVCSDDLEINIIVKLVNGWNQNVVGSLHDELAIPSKQNEF